MNMLKNAGTLLAFTAIGVLVLVTAVGCSMPHDETAASREPSRPTAAELLQKYQNEVAAQDNIGARNDGNALMSWYPESAEAKAIAAQLAELDAKMKIEEEAAAARMREARAKEAAKAAEEKAAMEAAKEENKAEAVKQFAKFKKKYDEVQGISFYYAPGAPMRDGTYFGLYLAAAEGDGSPTVRWKWRYQGDTWLFVERLIVVVDGQRLPDFDYQYGAVNRDNCCGDVWETHDEVVWGSEKRAMFLRLAKAKRVVVRFEGKQYYKDHVLTDAEKKGMLQVLNAYEYWPYF